MKKIFYFLLLLTSAKFALAQPFKTETSESFKGDIGVPVLVMQDGTTIFQFDDEKTRKMYLTIFDKSHNVIVNKKEVNFKKVNYVFHFSYQQSTHVKFWMESKKKAKVFMENDLKPYYVIIDPKTGNVEEETEIKDVEVGSITYVNGRSKDHVYVIKKEIDFATGNRIKISSTWKTLTKEEALAKTDFNDVSTLTFSFFDSDEKEIQKAEFDFMNKKYQAIDILNYTFKNNVVYFVSKMYKINDRETYDAPVRQKGAVGVVCFSKYDLNTKKFTHKELYALEESVIYDNCNIKFGSDNKTCYVVFFAKRGKEKVKGEYKYYYDIFFQNINVENFEIEKPFYVTNDLLNKYLINECNIKDGYVDGFLQDFFIDPQNNVVTVRVKNAVFSGSNVISYNPEIFGYTYMNKKGEELFSNVYKYDVGDVYGISIVNNKTVYNKNNFIYNYISTPKGLYLLCNNMEANNNLPANKLPKKCKAVDQTNMMLVSLSDKENKEFFVFGKPEGKSSNLHGNFRDVLYDEKNQTFIITVYEGPGFEKTKAAWIKLD